MAPTTVDNCSWCYGPLTEHDLTTPLGLALGAANAGACQSCVESASVLRPPDSVEPARVTLSGPVAWRLAVASLLESAHDVDSPAAVILRRIAGVDGR